MAVSRLEEEFERSEKRRLDVERRRLEPPKPVVERKPYEESVLLIKEEVKKIEETLQKLSLNDNTEAILELNKNVDGLQEVRSLLQSLNKKLDAEFEKQQKLRQLERETLTKLNTYLDNWV